MTIAEYAAPGAAVHARRRSPAAEPARKRPRPGLRSGRAVTAPPWAPRASEKKTPVTNATSSSGHSEDLDDDQITDDPNDAYDDSSPTFRAAADSDVSDSDEES